MEVFQVLLLFRKTITNSIYLAGFFTSRQPEEGNLKKGQFLSLFPLVLLALMAGLPASQVLNHFMCGIRKATDVKHYSTYRLGGIENNITIHNNNNNSLTTTVTATAGLLGY